eukprot:4026123-Prymnesium_polylepis.1
MTLEISGVSASSMLVLAVDQDRLPTSASLQNTNAHVQQLHLSILSLPSWLLQGVVDLLKSTITKQIVTVRPHSPPTRRAPMPCCPIVLTRRTARPHVARPCNAALLCSLTLPCRLALPPRAFSRRPTA